MKTKAIFALLLLVVGMTMLLALVASRRTPQTLSPPVVSPQSEPAAAMVPVPRALDHAATPEAEEKAMRTTAAPRAEAAALFTNRVERLNQIRETFHTLAAGDPPSALRAARELQDETERETALMTLVTEWTQGQLLPSRFRGAMIAEHGLEAGLGYELARQPALAAQWANELTDGRERGALLAAAAANLVRSDPSAAFALGANLPDAEREPFNQSVFTAWGQTDTAAAFDWANRLESPAARDAANQAIRSAAPVGIGAVLTMKDGLPVINDLVPGAPAALSGQIRPGDRIVALAQGDNAFVDARGLELKQIVDLVRGAPNTTLQLQVVSADAPANTAPHTVAIVRDQLLFKK